MTEAVGLYRLEPASACVRQLAPDVQAASAISLRITTAFRACTGSMSRSYLKGRQEVPEPPSIAARRRNSTATSVQLAPAPGDPKSRQYAHFIPQTPSPKQSFSPGKPTDYFRYSHGGGVVGSATGTTSPYALSNLNSTNQQQARRLSSINAQPPTPNVHQHVPAWNLREGRERQGSLSDHGSPGFPEATDDPLNILDTLPIQNLRLNSNAPPSDLRCGTLKRVAVPIEDHRTNTWPAGVVLNANPSTSGIASRRLQANASAAGPGHGIPNAIVTQSRAVVGKLRPVEPDTSARRSPEHSKLPHSTPHLNHATPADCFI